MSRRFVLIAVVAVLAGIAWAAYAILTGSVLRQLGDGSLVDADYWSDEPRILSAGLGFDNIIGISELTPEAVRAAGGAWNASLACADGGEPPLSARTSAATPDAIALAYRGYADYDDGLPVVFSWPVAGETVNPADFRFTLNTGERVFPHAAGLFPNWERNERNVVVLFGDFGNRGRPGEADAIFPVRLDIVDDGTPLTLVGPGGRQASAVGLSWQTDTTPYASGPYLVGAKLNRIGNQATGEGGVTLLDRAPYSPNDEFALYGGGDFRLRVLTTGGFSPDGVSALTPDSYERHFRIRAAGPDGADITLDKVGVDYAVAGGRLRILGLSDLGRKQDAYDGCYVEDRDNYIDVILSGDEAGPAASGRSRFRQRALMRPSTIRAGRARNPSRM